MKKLLNVLIIVIVLAGCANFALNTAYDVTRNTWVNKYSTYYTGPMMNKCSLTFSTATGEFKMCLHDPPAATYIVDDNDGKYRLFSRTGRETDDQYILLTKKYLVNHQKNGLHFTQGGKEYTLPGYYVEGFLTRVPAWSQ